MPVPRLSNLINRENDAKRSHVRASVGSVHMNSRWLIEPGNLDQIDRTVTHDLIRDADVAAARAYFVLGVTHAAYACARRV